MRRQRFSTMIFRVLNVGKIPKPQFISGARRLTDSAGEHTQYRLVDVGAVSNFVQRCLLASGALQSHAASLASVLVHADVRGHYSHGINRLGKRRPPLSRCNIQ